MTKTTIAMAAIVAATFAAGAYADEGSDLPESEQLLEVLIDGQPADRAVIPAPLVEEQDPIPAPVVETEAEEPAPAEAPEPAPEEEPEQVTETETAPVEETAPETVTEVATVTQTAPVPEAPAKAEEIDEINVEEDDAALTAKTPKVEGNLSNGMESLVDIECDDATLADVLRQFRKTTKANIISDDTTNLQKRVSISLHHVPWFQGMTAILNSRGFRIENRGGIYRVVEDKMLTPIFTRTYTLNHSSAKELADLFNDTFGRKDAAGKLITPVASSFNGANVVVVTATEKILSDCETIIAAVDKAVSQIYIEARFIEMSNEAMHKLGMQWNSLESWGASVRNLSGGMEYNNGRAANYGSLVSNRSTSGSSSNSGSSSGDSSSSKSTSSSDSVTYTGLVPTGISAATGAGRSAEDMAWRNARGFQGQLSVDDFRLAMSAFESMTDAKVFSNPKIIVSNGREAKVDMTTKYPNVTIDSNYTGQNSQNLSVSTKLDTIPGEDKFMFAKEAFFSWGIQLSVTPRISPDGLISVEIVPTISDCTGYVTVNSSQETDTPYTQYPIIDVKRLTTEFTMKDGATAVIGGLSRTSEEDVDSGIPLLRKIPWIGPKLFGWKSRGKVQKEIIVFVTVGIADPQNLPRDIGLPKNAVFGREYVLGTRLEPGDRDGSAANVFKLDKRLIDERDDAKGKKPLESGTVKITVVD